MRDEIFVWVGIALFVIIILVVLLIAFLYRPPVIILETKITTNQVPNNPAPITDVSGNYALLKDGSVVSATNTHKKYLTANTDRIVKYDDKIAFVDKNDNQLKIYDPINHKLETTIYNNVSYISGSPNNDLIYIISNNKGYLLVKDGNDTKVYEISDAYKRIFYNENTYLTLTNDNTYFTYDGTTYTLNKIIKDAVFKSPTEFEILDTTSKDNHVFLKDGKVTYS